MAAFLIAGLSMNRSAAAFVACPAMPLAAFAQELPRDRWNLADLYPATAA